DRQRGEAEPDDLEQDPAEPEQAEAHRQQRERERSPVHELASQVQVHGQLRCPSRRRSRISSSCDAARTTKVMRKRMSPSSISAPACRPGLASWNSFASAEVMLLPGWNSDTPVKRLVLPMTKVTAMVSPSARPSP